MLLTISCRMSSNNDKSISGENIKENYLCDPKIIVVCLFVTLGSTRL